MTATRIVLSPLGLKETDLRLLKTICALSEGRGRSYSFVCSPEPLPLPTLWVVDAEAEADWRERHGRRGAVAVFVTTVSAGSPEAPAGTDQHLVRRPLTASRLLAALDAVAEREIGQLSQMVIGGAATSGAAAPSSGMGLGRHSRYTALVVDDSPTIQKQIELSLRAHGITAVCADSGESAMKALQGGAFDIIFLDVMLPGGVDGYQICKSIKRDPAHRRTPVVMLTSKSSTFDRVRGSMSGCDTWLTKPVDTATFNSVVEKYLPRVEAAEPHPQFT